MLCPEDLGLPGPVGPWFVASVPCGGVGVWLGRRLAVSEVYGYPGGYPGDRESRAVQPWARPQRRWRQRCQRLCDVRPVMPDEHHTMIREGTRRGSATSPWACAGMGSRGSSE